MESDMAIHAQHTAVERRLQAMNKRQQRRRIRDSKTQDEGSLRTRRRSSEAYVPPAQEPAVVEATAEAQMWDLQMQNAFLRHQLALAEQKKDWLAHQLQEFQAKYAALTEQKAGQQELDAPRESSSWVSSSSSASDSDAVLWPSSSLQPQQLEAAAAAAPQDAAKYPDDVFNLFQLEELDLLPDVPEGLESVDHLTAHLPMGI